MDITREDLEMELAYWQQEAAGLQRQLVRAQIKLKRHQDAEVAQAEQAAEATQPQQDAEAVAESPAESETAASEQTKPARRRASKEK